MSSRFMIIMAVLLVCGLLLLVMMIRQRKLTLRYAIIWIILIIGLALLIFIPGSLNSLAKLLGIYGVTNMVFFLGFLFSIVLNFALTISASRNSERIRKLTQQMGLDEHEIRNREQETTKMD